MKTNLQTFLDKYVVATSHAEATDAFVDLVVEILGENETNGQRMIGVPSYQRDLLREEQMTRLEEMCKEES